MLMLNNVALNVTKYYVLNFFHINTKDSDKKYPYVLTNSNLQLTIGYISQAFYYINSKVHIILFDEC